MWRDIEWWESLLSRWNGVARWIHGADLVSFSDASNLGFGFHCGPNMRAGAWPSAARGRHINWKELRAIELSCVEFGASWTGRRVLFACDNLTAVHIINAGSSRNDALASCLRRIATLASLYDFDFRAVHIPGSANVLADALSRLPPPTPGRPSTWIYLTPPLPRSFPTSTLFARALPPCLIPCLAPAALQSVIDQALAKNTRNSYSSYVRQFLAWNALQHPSVDMTSLDAIAPRYHEFLAHLACDRKLSLSSVKVASSALINHFDAKVWKSHPLHEKVMKGITRIAGAPSVQKLPFRSRWLRRFIRRAREHNLLNVPTVLSRITLLSVGFYAALRRSAIAALNVGDIKFGKALVGSRYVNYARVLIRKSKTDPGNSGQSVLPPLTGIVAPSSGSAACCGSAPPSPRPPSSFPTLAVVSCRRQWLLS